MKDFKRVLSLGLAGTMLAGMMTVGASAANKDFTDADEITHVEAVDVMSTLGVLKGKDTGAFDPNTTVTRAEMAKIITVMLNGGNDPTLGSTSTVMFTDIQNHWAKSYIQYCANLGIIAGQGDGTFAPDAPVTGAAAAKMLLVALGYDADIAGYQGADWDLNVNRDANEAKLYDEIKTIDTSAGLSRDNTAQMAYNALEAKIMERTDHKVVGTGEVSYTYEQSKDTTFLNKYFDALTFIGSFEGNYNTQATGTKGYIAVKGRLDTDPATRLDNNNQEQPYYRATAQLPSDLDISNIGEEVKVIFKDGKGGRSNQPDKNDTIYGVFNTGRTEVVTDIRANVKDNKSTEKKVNIGGTKYDVADTVTVYTNYFASPAVYGTVPSGSTSAGTVAGTANGNSQLTDNLHAYNGDTIKAIVNPDTNKIDTVYITTSKIAAVTAKNATKITMNNNVGTITVADHEVYEDVKKGDVVVVTTLYDAVGEDLSYTIVEKAESVTGTVKAYDGVKTVTVDGTKYNIQNRQALLGAIPEETVTTAFNDDCIGEEFELFLVNGYVGAAVQTSQAASNYSLVTAVRNTNNSSSAVFDALQLQVMDSEGKKTIISPNDDSKKADGTAATKQNDFKVGDIVVWSGKADDATVTVKAAVSTAANYTYNSKTKSINGAVAAANCVLFAETSNNAVSSAQNGELAGAKYNTYDLRTLGTTPSTGTVPTTYVTNSDGKIVAAFMDLASKPSGSKDATVYGVVSAAGGRVEIDGSYYYNFTVDSNDAQYDVNVGTKGNLATGKLVSFEPTSDATYSSNDITIYSDGWTNQSDNTPATLKANAVYVKEHSEADKTVTYYTQIVTGANGYEGMGESTLALDSDCVIIWVDADNEKAGNDMGTVSAFDSVTGLKNAALVVEKDGSDWVIVAIFAETSNEVNILTGGDTAATQGKTVDSVAAKVTLVAGTQNVDAALRNAEKVTSGKLYQDGVEQFDVTALLANATSKSAKIIEFTIPNAKAGDKVKVDQNADQVLDGDKLQLIVGAYSAQATATVTITHTPVDNNGTDGAPVTYTVEYTRWQDQ